MRLISAMPRGVAANVFSSAMTPGCRLVMASRAMSASASVNESSSPFKLDARCFRPGRTSFPPMMTVHGSIERPSICHNRGVHQPPYTDLTVGALLTTLARALPQRDALVYEHGPRYTFENLEHEARTIARGLIASGVEPGERVVVWATNVPEWVVLQFALAKVGAILVTANTLLRAKDIEYVLRQSEAATLVTIGGFRDLDYVEELRRAGATSGRIPTLRRLIFIGANPPDGFMPYETLRR